MEECGIKHEALNLRITHSETLAKAKADELERRLHGLNELRADVIKDRELFVRADLYNFAHRAMEAHLQNTDKNVASLSNQLIAIDSKNKTWTAAIALLFTIVSIALHFWRGALSK